VKELLAAEYAEQRSKEWLELRENMITASDVASALGENHYESVDAFVKKKVLRTQFQGNAATAHGTLLEPLVRDLYDQRTGRKSHEIGLVRHREYPWLGASPDGITEDGLLIEIKCPLTRKIEAKVPKHYWPQVQLQLEITDLDECDFIQYRPASAEGVVPQKAEEFVVVRVARDREWFAKNLPAMKAAWDRIVAGRIHGLCELVDESPDQFKNEIVCELVEDDNTGGGVQGCVRSEADGSTVLAQEQVPEMPGMRG
jgi:putative phage-type endonuclease